MWLPTLAKEFDMDKLYRGLVLVLGVLLFGGGNFAWAQTAPAGDAANGKRVYLAVGCFTCHCRSGQGGSYNGPAPALADTKLPLEAFKVFVRLGPNDMPAYPESVLSDKDTADILAFLRSLPGRRPAKDFPLLNQ
jgi:mono/diheme cytochrome c family protein